MIEPEDRRMRYALVVLWMLCWSATPAMAQVSIGIGLPSVSIGINLPVYPELVRVPGYPVYYAPRLGANFFFYDGMYWVYESDNWYASSWYNGPWGMVGPEYVPLFVLRIPVSYYRNPPPYFRGWRRNAPPRWGEHWGSQWEQRRSGWDSWNRKSAPAPAPLPVYQRQYSGDRYPRVEQQPALHGEKYRYQPRDPVVQQHYKERAVQKAPARAAPEQRVPQRAPKEKSGGQPDVQRSAPARAPDQQRDRAVQRVQPAPKSSPESSPQDKGVSKDTKRGQGQDKDEGRGRERGR
jgi:hypothetical protein